MHTPSIMHLVALAVAIGKAAIGGAGFMLAILGAVNAFISTNAFGWAHMWFRPSFESLSVPYSAAVGALLGGIAGAKAWRKT